MGRKRRAREEAILRVMSAERPFKWMTARMIKELVDPKNAKWVSHDLSILYAHGYVEVRHVDEVDGFVDPHPQYPGLRRNCFRVTEDGSRLPAQRELARRGRRFGLRLRWA